MAFMTSMQRQVFNLFPASNFNRFETFKSWQVSSIGEEFLKQKYYFMKVWRWRLRLISVSFAAISFYSRRRRPSCSIGYFRFKVPLGTDSAKHFPVRKRQTIIFASHCKAVMNDLRLPMCRQLNHLLGKGSMQFGWWAVWPVKNCQMSIKVPQKWFHKKNDRFWHLFENCRRM